MTIPEFSHRLITVGEYVHTHRYTDDVTWRLNHSLAPNIAGPHTGIEATCAFNKAVFTKFYKPGALHMHAACCLYEG